MNTSADFSFSAPTPATSIHKDRYEEEDREGTGKEFHEDIPTNKSKYWNSQKFYTDKYQHISVASDKQQNNAFNLFLSPKELILLHNEIISMFYTDVINSRSLFLESHGKGKRLVG